MPRILSYIMLICEACCHLVVIVKSPLNFGLISAAMRCELSFYQDYTCSFSVYVRVHLSVYGDTFVYAHCTLQISYDLM